MNFAPLIFCINALEGFYAHRERKALHRIGRKIRLQQLSDQEFAGVEARCTSLNLNVHNKELRVVRALTQHVVRMERLRRELVPLWTRAEMLAMVGPHNLINRDRIETCLQWLRSGERAFHQYAQSVEAQFDRYLNQLGTVAPQDRDVGSTVKNLQNSQLQHRHLHTLILQELQIIQQLHVAASQLATLGQVRIDAQGNLISDDPNFALLYKSARLQLARLETESTGLLEDMQIIPPDPDSGK